MKNYYDVLGVSEDATLEEIKNAYRNLAKKYHPDSSGSDEDKERFQEIQEAYAVLSDPDKRKMYKYYGHDAYRKSYHAQHSTGEPMHEHGGCGHGEGDCNGDCANCQNGHHHSHKEREEIFRHIVRVAVWMEMEETFSEVIKDASLKMRIPNPDRDSAQRYVEKEWTFQVKLPANTYEKQIFNLEDVLCGDRGLMDELTREYPDNHYVVIVLLRDKPGYTRQDYHLYLDYTVDFYTLVLGGAIRVPSLTEEFLFEMPAGTSPEKKVRIAGRGLNYPPKIGKRGDLYLNLHVRIPTQLTEAQKNAFQMLREAFEPA